MRKFLACDVDGTLLHSTQPISKEDIEAVKKFRSKGHYFALCTGRTINWVVPIFNEYPLESDGLILDNGAALYDIEKREPFTVKQIFLSSIPAAIGVEIISYLYHQENIAIYWGDGVRTYELIDRPLPKAESFTEASEDTVFLTLEDFCKNPIDIVGFGACPLSKDAKDALLIKKALQKHWGNLVNIFSNVFFVDVAAKNVSKGEGIKRMQEHINQDFSVYTIGDSFNDESMFIYAGKNKSYLLKNGAEELRPLVKKTVTSVAECIEDILKDEA